MKKAMFMFLLFLVFSCANSERNENMVANEDSVLLEYESLSENFTLEKLVSEKLQGYFELLKLEKEHPEFKEDILLQLDEISKEEIIKVDREKNFSMENIRSAGPLLKLSDSVQKLKIYYDLRSHDGNETDSLSAIITSKKIMLDGLETRSTKIGFSLIN